MKKRYSAMLWITLFTCILMYPYLVRDFLPVEHDTFFHLSRIEHLSRAVREGSFLPAVYPDENMGFGYASPLFYSDVLLIIPAMLHLAGLALSSCYKTAVFAAVWLSGYTMYRFAERTTDDRMVSLTASAAYLWSNYHITDVYVRGALGEVFAFSFLPVVLSGMYEILIQKNGSGGKILTAGLSLLALSHNLTFLMGSVLCAVLFLIFLPHVSGKTFYVLCVSVFTAFLLTAFFTIPMIEQLAAQKLIVSRYNGSGLAGYAMTFRQYFVNRTVFGLAGNNRPLDQTMIENIGLFLTFAPALYFFTPKKERNPFLMSLTVLGYIFWFLPSALLPWQYMTFLGILQFPWRLNTMALLLLSVPAASAVCRLLKKPALVFAVLAVLGAECIWHVYPVLSRTFGMVSGMSWQNVLDGDLCDPCYSAYYVRVELAGGDYLPVTSPDFRTQTTAVTDSRNRETDIQYHRTGSLMTFTLDEETDTYTLPITWYKGYQVYRRDQSGMKKMVTQPSGTGLVSFRSEGAGQYLCMYENTPLRTLNLSLSGLTLALVIMEELRKRNFGIKKAGPTGDQTGRK